MQIKIVVTFLILLCAANVYPQSLQCSLKLTQLPDAPELFGFRMGMTAAQVKARVPQVMFGHENEFGLSKTSINPDWDPRIDKSAFAGVRTISLDFLDGRLTSLWFGYDSSFKWQTVPDFVKGTSQSLRLPDTWISWKTRGQQLHCADFQMVVTIVADSPSFHITDATAEETLTARRAAKEEQESPGEDGSSEGVTADKQAKIYYSAGCVPSKELKEGNRIIFKSTEEAARAGYKLASQCQ